MTNHLETLSNLFEDKNVNVQWKTELSNTETILFYKVNEGKEDLAVSRLSQSSYKVVITNKTLDLPNLISVSSQDWSSLKKEVMDKVYPLDKNIKFIGITGTNGKTTTAHLTHQILVSLGYESLLVGTLGFLDSKLNQLMDHGTTTPDYIDLHYEVFKNKNLDYCILEASSHALHQDRLCGLSFDCAGWTNLTQDHLDYHESLEEYFSAKKIILKHLKKETHLFVSEKDVFEKVVFPGKILVSDKERKDLPLFLSSGYNKKNLELAVSLVEAATGRILCNTDFSQLNSVPGRFNLYEARSNIVIIDYAHTPDAIKNICLEVKKEFTDKEIVTVFGCGGDRDRGKRPLMLTAAEAYSNSVVVTSDNPRFEDPQDIIKDIVVNNDLERVRVQIDRPKAIREAINRNNNCVILVLGKGNEPYLDIKGVKHPYSDESIVKEFIDAK